MERDVIAAIVNEVNARQTPMKALKLPKMPSNTIKVSVETVTKYEFQFEREK
jgi:hypothetical protein